MLIFNHYFCKLRNSVSVVSLMLKVESGTFKASQMLVLSFAGRAWRSFCSSAGRVIQEILRCVLKEVRLSNSDVLFLAKGKSGRTGTVKEPKCQVMPVEDSNMINYFFKK